jgi:SsrA-binding protein
MAKKGKRKAQPGDVATNRQASFRFELLDRVEAGAVLTGTEVKALRTGGGQLKDAYAVFRDGEVWLHNMHIPPYPPATLNNHPPERPRKLLLHKKEILRLQAQQKEKGLTVVPTRVYFKDNKAKVELALAKGKDRFDKRESIKEKDMARDAQRQLREAAR